MILARLSRAGLVGLSLAGFAACSTPTPAPTDATTDGIRPDVSSSADAGDSSMRDQAAPVDDSAADVAVNDGADDAMTADVMDDVVSMDAVIEASVDSGVADTGACAAGQVRCGGACVSVTDPAFGCGSCAPCVVANGAASCAMGRCSIGSCSAGFANCDGNGDNGCETDTRVSSLHCGACGVACSMSQTCAAGACVAAVVCGAGQTDCGGTCVNTSSNNSHCGACGNACPAGQSCTTGVCQCPAGQTLCAGSCVNTATSSAHCGTCGNACSAGRSCVASACVCPAGQSFCGGACVDTASSNAHCGACGSACTAGRVCASGACVCPAGTKACAGACVPDNNPATGCAGPSCASCSIANGAASCAAGACAVASCAAGFADCTGGAADGCETNTQVSNAHCGRCGTPCGAGTVCVGGTCVAASMCGAGQTDCGGTCVNTSSNNSHCGACGNACPAGQSCASGVCQCPAGQTSCGGTCVDLGASNSNCGACGNTCSGGQTCASGVCQCPAGQTLCNGMCVSTSSSNAHCGACNNACAGGQNCASGSCACGAGESFCNGTCTNTSSNNSHCGACNNACGGGSSCVAGACVCPAGQALCAGTCVNTAMNNSHCGACNNACTGGRTCAASACVCGAGQTFCGGNCTTTATDSNHCGACGTVCSGATPVCIAGVCSAAPPPHDTRAGAIGIDLTVPSQTIVTNTATATANASRPASCGSSCATMGRDVFYTFTLSAPEIVYVNTYGSSFDTLVHLQDAMGNNLTSVVPVGMAHCNDDATLCMASTQSALVDYLPAGTYYIVLRGCSATQSGAATLQVQHFPAGSSGVPALLATTVGATSTYPFTNTGTGLVANCGCASGPESSFWWISCPTSAAVNLTASTCPSGAALDTAVSVRTATGGVQTCANDNCGTRSTASIGIPAAAGLGVVYADTCSNATGSSTLFTTFGSCAAGTTMCSGRCVDLQFNNDHCGACGNVCGAGTSCDTGACRPNNNARTNAIPLTLSAAGEVSLTGSTVNATRDGATVSGCGSVASCPNGPNVWYSFTLSTPAVVYFDTAGSATDTYLFVTDSTGALVPAQPVFGRSSPGLCNDDAGCGTVNDWTSSLNSRTAGYFGPGTYYVSVGTCGALPTGAFTLRGQMISPTTGISSSRTALGMGTQTGTFTTLPVPGQSGTCGGGAPNGTQEHLYPFYTCGGFTGWLYSTCATDGGTYTRRVVSGGTTYNFDPVMYIRSARTGAQTACNNDGGSSGAADCRGTGGDMLHLGARIAPGGFSSLQRGLNVLYVDSNTGTTGPMSYTLAYQTPN